jgi:hypothetical protein
MVIDILLAVSVGTLSIVMAVIGGVTATQKRALRLSFVAMGAFSVAFVILQAIRATEGQDALAASVAQLREAQGKLSEAQGGLAKAQTELRGLTTGGEAYPSLWVLGSVDDSGAPGSARFILQNHDQTRSLYAVSVGVSFAKHGEHCCGHLLLDEPPTIPEIAPGAEVVLGDFSFKDSVEVYELGINARNGEFVATVEWKGDKWVSTVKRSGSDAVLEQTDQPPEHRVHAK